MKRPTIEIRTERANLVAGNKQTVDVLVRISPPEIDTEISSRPKMNIGIALDRSGSMSGEKMREARDAAKYCVDQLLSTDRFSTVIFDDHVDVLFTNQLVTDRELLKHGLDRIEHRGSTALYEGWLSAGRQVSEAFDSAAINRVLLITDGQANVGETNPDRIVSGAREAAERGVTTTTIGIGADFTEDLLIAMADAGSGNAWHVEGPEDMAHIFETELKGLIRQFAHSVTLAAETAEGVRVVDMLNDLGRDGDTLWTLPALQSGSPFDVVLRLEISEQAAISGELAKFTLRYRTKAVAEQQDVGTGWSPDFDTQLAVDGLGVDTTVAEAVRLLMNARARREAIAHMDRGDVGASVVILRSVADQTEMAFEMAPSPALAQEISELNDLAGRFENRVEPQMSRKRAFYQSEARRKGNV